MTHSNFANFKFIHMHQPEVYIFKVYIHGSGDPQKGTQSSSHVKNMYCY